MRRHSLVAIPFLFMFAAAQAGDVKADIDTANQKLGAAFAKGDATAIAQLYTPQATMFPPGSDIVSGRDGVQKYWAEAIKSGMKLVGLTTVSVDQYGDAAREIGRFTVEVPNPQKQMVKIEGKYIVVWRQMDGKWMLDSDIWNMNQQ
jgi:uncharacterized protein (TIGR02246 family)